MLWDCLLIQQEKHKHAIGNWSLLPLDLIGFKKISIHFHYSFHKCLFWDGFLKNKGVDFIFRGQIYNSAVDKTFLLRWRKVYMRETSIFLGRSSSIQTKTAMKIQLVNQLNKGNCMIQDYMKRYFDMSLKPPTKEYSKILGEKPKLNKNK